MSLSIHSRPMAPVAFGAAKKAPTVIPYQGLNSWSDNGVGPVPPKAQWVSKTELRKIADSMPTIAIYPPPPPMDITNKIGVKIAARSTAGFQGIWPTVVQLDKAKKVVKIAISQDVSNGGTTMQVRTSYTSLMFDKKDLPKDYKDYTFEVTLTKV